MESQGIELGATRASSSSMNKSNHGPINQFNFVPFEILLQAHAHERCLFFFMKVTTVRTFLEMAMGPRLRDVRAGLDGLAANGVISD